MKKEIKKFRQAVFVVVYTKGKKGIEYLILKRYKHWKGWEFPKGGIEKNENLKAAVRRECYEESGNRPIKISRYPFSGEYIYGKTFKDRPGYIGQSYALWSAEIPEDKKIRFDRKEHSGYLWLPFNKAIKILKYENQKKCLKIVNKSLKNLN